MANQVNAFPLLAPNKKKKLNKWCHLLLTAKTEYNRRHTWTSASVYWVR